MKFLTLALPALLAHSVTATPTWSATAVSTVDDDLDVPGDNPLKHCGDPADDILAIKKIDLSPNPPKAGEKLTITATGVLAHDIAEGAEAHLQVKYGPIKIINQVQDLCELVKNVDLECPLKKGNLKLTKDVELPSAIPPGTYSVEANLTTVDHDIITCLQASVLFPRPGSAALFKQDM